MDSQIIDLIFIGDIDKTYLIQLIEKVEKLIKRKIRYLTYTEAEGNIDFKQFDVEPLLLWSEDEI